MKVMKRLLERRLRDGVTFDDIRIGFMPGKRTIDAIFVTGKSRKNLLTRTNGYSMLV